MPSPCWTGVMKWLTFLVQPPDVVLVRQWPRRRTTARRSSLVELLLTNWIAPPPDWSPPCIVFE